MSSIGKDLNRIRHFKKLTLQDLHKKTRISLAILEELEDGRLFAEPVENEVYVRSYTRTYARALGIPEDLVTAALDQQKKGAYDGLLLEPYPGIVQKTTAHEAPSRDEKPSETSAGGVPNADKSTEKEQKPKSEAASGGTDSSGAKKADSDPVATGKPTVSGEEPATNDKSANSSGSETSSTPPHSSGKETSSKSSKTSGSEAKPGPAEGPRKKKTADQIDWAAMGKRFSTETRRSSGWILGLGMVLLFVAMVLWVAFRTDFLTNLFDSDDAAQEMVTEPQSAQNAQESDSGLGLELGDGVAASPDPDMNQNETTPTRLDSTLYLTIYGAHGALDPVRVWSDLKPRFDPYWIEQGEALQFEFSDTIRVRSQYAESLLFLNGHRIENPRELYYNSAQQSVELTRDLFTPEAQWASPRELQLPDTVAVPDTVRMRPTFN